MDADTSGPFRVAVLGSGSLARAVCNSLAVQARHPVRAAILARDGAAAAEACQVARVRASLSGTAAAFRAERVRIDEVEELSAVFEQLRPQVVLLCASLQSPWEPQHAPSAWTSLLGRAGFGLTLPFHAELARTVGLAVVASCADAVYLNAAFPDAVNPVLAASGVPVTAGVGNVAVLAAAMQTALGLADQDELAVLGHHIHLHAPHDPEQEARAWLASRPLAVPELLAAQRRVDRARANDVTGHTIAILLDRLAAGGEVRTHLPGPRGLPGGYPVGIDRHGVRLRLPDGVGEGEAVRLNQRWSDLDGVRVADGLVHLSPTVVQAVRAYTAEFPDQYRVADIRDAADELARLRADLRGQPRG